LTRDKFVENARRRQYEPMQARLATPESPTSPAAIITPPEK
jgi:hypothetical protein